MKKLPPVNEFDIAQIDDVIHGRVRLGVMAYLAATDAGEFNMLKQKIGATDGTLSVHLRKLEEAGYIAIEKNFRNRRPLTTARLTPKAGAPSSAISKRSGSLQDCQASLFKMSAC